MPTLTSLGFEMRDQGGNFQAYGVGGVNLQNLWGDHPEAYYGMRETELL
jgi:hypothetical protein